MKEVNREDLVGKRVWVRFQGENEMDGLVTRESTDAIFLMSDGTDDETEIPRREINELEITFE